MHLLVMLDMRHHQRQNLRLTAAPAAAVGSRYILPLLFLLALSPITAAAHSWRHLSRGQGQSGSGSGSGSSAEAAADRLAKASVVSATPIKALRKPLKRRACGHVDDPAAVAAAAARLAPRVQQLLLVSWSLHGNDTIYDTNLCTARCTADRHPRRAPTCCGSSTRRAACQHGSACFIPHESMHVCTRRPSPAAQLDLTIEGWQLL